MYVEMVSDRTGKIDRDGAYEEKWRVNFPPFWNGGKFARPKCLPRSVRYTNLIVFDIVREYNIIYVS